MSSSRPLRPLRVEVDIADDCWETVFQFLPTADKVNLGLSSRRCHRVMRFSGSWPTVDLTGQATDAVMRLLFRTWQLRPSTVVLSDSAVSDVGLSELQSCSELNSLDLTRCREITDDGIGTVAGLPLKALSLFACSRVTDASLKLLSNSPMESLNLISCKNITNSGLSSLPRALKSLNLSGCSVSDEGVCHLQTLPLIILHLSRCPVTDRCLPSLRALPLQVLHLVATDVTAAGVRHLRDLPLKRLYLNHCRKLNSKSVLRRLGGSRIEIAVLPNGTRHLGPFPTVASDDHVLDVLPASLLSLQEKDLLSLLELGRRLL